MKDTILYIDDEQANLDGFQMVFGSEYEVILCRDAKEVYQIVKEKHIKILLSDQRMPTITGLDLCERVNKIDPRVICILVTAYADIGVTVQAINQGGIYGFILKPWRKEELAITLGNAIQKYNLSEENKQLVHDLENKNIELIEKTEELRINEAHLNAIFDNTPLILLLIDQNLDVIRVNKIALNIHDKNEDDLIGLKGGDVIKCMHNQDQENGCGFGEYCKKCILRDTVLSSLNGKVDYFKQETIIPTRHEDKIVERVVLVSTNYLESKDGPCVLVSIDDITSQKEAAMELKAYNEELQATTDILRANEKLLEKKNEELFTAKTRAEESDRLKSSFLANMSHEIRTPMNGIIGFAELLTRTNISPDKKNYFTEIIKNSSQQLLSIVNDILDFSKIETGQIDLREEEVQLSNVLQSSYDLYSLKAKEKQLELIIESGNNDDSGTIVVDKTKLSQILNNLINNALKFTQKGEVRFGYQQKGKKLVFYVKDTGIGIDDNGQQSVFERFYQVDSTNTRQYGGTGLGLAICKGYVELMNGEIWVESEPGIGSTFFFTLPLNDLTPVSPGDSSKAFDQSSLLNTKCILIAEDEESNYYLLEELFSDLKVKIIHAKTGKEAVEFCDKHQEIDLILMDIRMPEMDGMEATQRIKEKRPDLPVVALTAYAYSEDREQVMEICDAYLSKPVDFNELINVLNSFDK